MRSKVLTPLLMAAVIWLGARVWHDSGEGSRKPLDESAPKAALLPANARQRAADFTLTTVQGSSLQLASYTGQSPVILEFFATWCPHCREALPHLTSLYQKYHKAGLEILLVSSEPADRLREFTSRAHIPFPVLSDPLRKAQASYCVNGIPFAVLIDRDRKIAKAMAGYSRSVFQYDFVRSVERVLQGN